MKVGRFGEGVRRDVGVGHGRSDRHAGLRNAGHRNAGHRNAGHRNAGHRNAGHRNAGLRNAGLRGAERHMRAVRRCRRGVGGGKAGKSRVPPHGGEDRAYQDPAAPGYAEADCGHVTPPSAGVDHCLHTRAAKPAPLVVISWANAEIRVRKARGPVRVPRPCALCAVGRCAVRR
ncbi:hypothetical protein [Sinosporangium siamense]|uniref:hypothetical protein n=1 Tax=Sinosporangium siamense TaxID=1367973 RepID=UPI00194E6A60